MLPISTTFIIKLSFVASNLLHSSCSVVVSLYLSLVPKATQVADVDELLVVVESRARSLVKPRTHQEM